MNLRETRKPFTHPSRYANTQCMGIYKTMKHFRIHAYTDMWDSKAIGAILYMTTALIVGSLALRIYPFY